MFKARYVAAAVIFFISQLGFASTAGSSFQPCYDGLYLDLSLAKQDGAWLRSHRGVYQQHGFTQALTWHHEGVTYGADIGQQYSRFFAVEAGAYRMPTVRSISATNANRHFTLKSWMAYLAAVPSVPLSSRVSLFGKAGIAYQRLHWIDHVHGQKSNQNVKEGVLAPLVGGGARVYINPNLSVAAQMLMVLPAKKSNNIYKNTPRSSLYVMSMSYISPIF